MPAACLTSLPLACLRLVMSTASLFHKLAQSHLTRFTVSWLLASGETLLG